MSRVSLPCRSAVVLALLALCCVGEKGWAQKPPPPGKPNPQAPVLNAPMPLGAQRGTTLEITLTGTNLAEPTGVLLGFAAKATIPTDNKNGQDNTKLRVRLEIPADAPLGVHSFRLATTRGMSNLRLFCVDELPQILKVDTSRNKATPQALTVPCTVVGRLDAEASDWYKITAKAGQRLSFDVLGHRLGSPIDPELSLYNAKTGQKVAYENDSPGCQTDPRLTWTFKEAGDYLVEINDTLNRGGADYGYRLRIGDFPCATVPIPMAARRGSKVTVKFAGPTVEGVAPVEVQVPADPAAGTVWVAPKGASGLHGWPVALAVSDLDELVEQEPNNDPAKANRIPVPGGITGRFEQSDDVDYYLFNAKKGQKLLIEAQTLELYSPTLVYMVVRNAQTKAELAKTNPQALPPLDQRIDFTAPADGDYLLEVQHLNFVGGPSEAYRVTVTPSVPGFDLSLAIERYDTTPGGVLSLPLLVTRRGYTGPIAVSVKGPPGFSGEVTVPAGQPAKPGQPGATLVVKVGRELQPGPFLISLEGKATEKGVPAVELANLRTIVSGSLGGLPFPPRHLNTQIALAVKERPPFALTAKFDPPQAVPGSPVTVTISVTRDADFAEEIALLPPTGLPPGVPAPALKPIPKGQNEVKLALNLTPKTPLGKFDVTFNGKGKRGTKEYVVSSAPAVLVVGAPFALTVEPAKASLPAGGKAKLKIVANRQGGYQGPIAVELRNLPAGVLATKAVIAMGQNMVEVELTAAANAAIASRQDVNVLGTATAAGNLQGASPNFAVSVTKK
ncbi:MAG TPA: PPC domain-containing protein [Gemmataceae bacterium]|nr:PPC domain-containing protein [Gemmataceae bacterium]